MIDFWPLIGVVIITLGLAFKLNTLMVILTAGIVTGLVAHIPLFEILSILGESFTKNRYMSLFILILPMIGILERFGLRQRAETLIASMKNASVSRILLTYLTLRKITNAMGLHLGGHPSMIRPLIAPMAEAAAEKKMGSISDEQSQRIRCLSAVSENFANFFSQLLFIGAGGLLLIKGVMADNNIHIELQEMYLWALPTAFASFVVFFICCKLEDKRLARQSTLESINTTSVNSVGEQK